VTGSDPLPLVVTAYVAMAAFMAGLWALQLRLRNASIADAGWCLGLVLIVCWYAGAAHGDTDRRWLVAIMGSIYALRLGFYILIDRVLGKAEDARYQRLRQEWGEQQHVRMFFYFQLQAAAIALFSLPFLVLMQNPRPTFSLWELAGALLWLLAVTGESMADWQLARFRAKPWNRDRVCREGLWRYSRHPNYFFEWLHWWAYVVMGVGLPNWGVTLLGPLVMGWALLKVTGIPPSEEQAVAGRGEEYRLYQRTTSAFFPWFPKTEKRGREP
jgi:steroid 5-alpha reductase family enzyme